MADRSYDKHERRGVCVDVHNLCAEELDFDFGGLGQHEVDSGNHVQDYVDEGDKQVAEQSRFSPGTIQEGLLLTEDDGLNLDRRCTGARESRF